MNTIFSVLYNGISWGILIEKGDFSALKKKKKSGTPCTEGSCQAAHGAPDKWTQRPAQVGGGGHREKLPQETAVRISGASGPCKETEATGGLLRIYCNFLYR